jgi:hypothetical protein
MITNEQKEKIKQVLAKVVKVENMTSNKGNKIANQFILYGDDFTLFQSYASPIVMRFEGKVYLFQDYDYSKTTGKYRNDFLNEGIAETRNKLKTGEYIAVDFEVA